MPCEIAGAIFFLSHETDGKGINQGSVFWFDVVEPMTAGLTGALAWPDLSVLSDEVRGSLKGRVCLTIQRSIAGTWWVLDKELLIS